MRRVNYSEAMRLSDTLEQKKIPFDASLTPSCKLLYKSIDVELGLDPLAKLGLFDFLGQIVIRRNLVGAATAVYLVFPAHTLLLEEPYDPVRYRTKTQRNL
jgi:hypothetical protein